MVSLYKVDSVSIYWLKKKVSWYKVDKGIEWEYICFINTEINETHSSLNSVSNTELAGAHRNLNIFLIWILIKNIYGYRICLFMHSSSYLVQDFIF